MPVRVTVVGAGYVGLVAAACLADFGADVICVDRDGERIGSLLGGKLPIYEPGLETLIHRGQVAGQLRFSTDLPGSAGEADIIFIAVGTPSREVDGYPDMRQVETVVSEIAPTLAGYTLVVTKSTVPVGTGRWLEALFRELRPDADVDVASNPEFLREGQAVKDFLRPDRVVIGTRSLRAGQLLRELYRPLERAGTAILATTPDTAELIKYAANAFLATKITFINEMADLCERLDANIEVVAEGLGLDKRIGPHFLRPGPGYGGSCFPKDTRALISMANLAGMPARLVETVAFLNDQRKAAMAERIVDLLGGDVRGLTLAILGVTFKAHTDDMREAPSLDILPKLQELGAGLQVYDPAGEATARPLLPGVEWMPDPYEAARDADALLILTEWPEFADLDLQRLGSLLRQRQVIDLRNVYPAQEMQRAGLAYYGVGRAASDCTLRRASHALAAAQ